MIDTLQLITGIDIPIPEIPLIIHPLSIKEISYFGEAKFFEVLQLLCLKKESFFQIKDESLLQSITDFQIFMKVINEKEMSKKKQDVSNLLQLLVTGSKVTFTPQTLLIMFNDNNSIITIDDNNFPLLQEALRQIFCLTESTDMVLNPKGKKAQEIAEKIKKGRDRVAKQKANESKSIFSQYLSSLSIGSHIPLQNLVELTMFQIYDLLERQQLYMSWDIDIRARLAGADIKKEPENWMKNIH